jgi:hypothetical protein
MPLLPKSAPTFSDTLQVNEKIRPVVLARECFEHGSAVPLNTQTDRLRHVQRVRAEINLGEGSPRVQFSTPFRIMVRVVIRAPCLERDCGYFHLGLQGNATRSEREVSF